MFKVFGGLLFAICSYSCYATEVDGKDKNPFLNLSLSYFNEEGYPTGWYVEAPESSLSVSPFVSDNFHGTSLQISATEPVVMYTPILVEECVKKIEARLSVRSMAEISSAVFFINPREGGLNAAQLSVGDGTTQKISHQIESAEACFQEPILLGVMASGKGEIKLGQFELKINNERFQDGNRPSEIITIEQLESLKQNAIQVNSLELGLPNQELDKMIPWVAETKVIGLGENSHGAKDLFLLKSKIIQHLIEKQGFSQIALEMPAIKALMIDDYIKGKHHDRKATLYALNYPSWQTESMMELIDWLKAINKKREVPISFSGFDIQQPQLTLAELQNHVAKIKDKPATKLLGELSVVLAEQTQLKEKVNLLLKELATYFDENIPSLKRFIGVLEQGLILQYPELGQGSRSEFMAAQVLILSESQKTILWADNTHITKQASAMGHYIAASLAEKYKAVGFSFHQGSYSAYGPNNPYPANPSFKGSHEFILNQLGMGSLLINLTHLPKASPLLDLRAFRYIGSRPQTYTQFYPHRLNEHFDMIGFVKNTEHTSYLIEHEFK